MSHEQSDRSNACVLPEKDQKGEQRGEEVTWTTDRHNYQLKTFSLRVRFHTTFTYKFFWAWEIKELDEAEVVSGHQVEASVGNTGTVNVRFLSVTRPNAENLVTQDARNTKQKTA